MTTPAGPPPYENQPEAAFSQPAYQQPPPYGAPPAYAYPQYGQPPPGMYQVDPSAPWGRQPVTGQPYSEKQKLVAGLLQIFLGHFGAGRWYLGYKGVATAQLLTLGGLGIWAIVDAIRIFLDRVPDTQGRPLRD
jgi:hypothetical protein